VPECNPTPKRRRVPISIVDSPTSPKESASQTEQKGAPIESVASSSSGFDIQEVSSRSFKDGDAAAATTTPGVDKQPSPQTPPTTSSSSKAASFAQAKQAREAKITKVGGGIFRASGQHTIFPTRDVTPSSPTPSSDPVAKKENEDSSHVPVEEEPLPLNGAQHQPVSSGDNEDLDPSAPATLFDLIRAWRSMLTSVERWKLLQVNILYYISVVLRI
jgi:hypothetical protein